MTDRLATYHSLCVDAVDVPLNVELDRSSPVPLYYQLAQAIEAAIREGELAPGDRFENELASAKRLALSRPTSRRAIQELVDTTGLPHPLFLSPEGANGAVIRSGGRELINFSSYNYLELARHPRVVAAADAATARYGTSASATRIVTGEIPPGAELSQVKLAEITGVSTTPVREALRQLEVEGLVESRRNRRPRVPSFDPEDLDAVYASRILLEARRPS